MESHASPEIIDALDAPKTAKRAAKPLATAPGTDKEAPIAKPKSLAAKSRMASSERPARLTPLHRAAKPVTLVSAASRETLAVAAAAGAAKESVIGMRSVTHDNVAQLAYSYWLTRGRQGGNPYDDWIRAEHELRSER